MKARPWSRLDIAINKNADAEGSLIPSLQEQVQKWTPTRQDEFADYVFVRGYMCKPCLACGSAEHSLMDIVDGRNDNREWVYSCPLVQEEDWDKLPAKKPWYRAIKVCPEKLSRSCRWDTAAVRDMVARLFISGNGYPHNASQKEEFLGKALRLCEERSMELRGGKENGL